MPEFCKCKYRTFFSINRYFARKIANFFEINSLTTDFYPPLLATSGASRLPAPEEEAFIRRMKRKPRKRQGPKL